MRILHVTPHLPPDQAANALLPAELGAWARARGDEVGFLAHPPRAGQPQTMAGPVEWIPRSAAGSLPRWLRAGSARNAWRITRRAGPLVDAADIVHVHSNGLLAELAVRMAAARNTPVVLTLYGTEIWHYRPKRWGPDLFTRAYRAASAVTFYSERLLARATELGLNRPGRDVIYPAVAAAFHPADDAERLAIRRSFGIREPHLIVNVKRLHPLAGQRYLIDAMRVLGRTDVRLVICGGGPLEADLQERARAAGVADRVTFAGLVDNATVARYSAAADVFALPSILEALPTVAVEALACATPVVSSDNPGGLELHEVFADDVEIVPKEDAAALAAAIDRRLSRPRRTSPATQEIIERRFRPDAVAEQYWRVYGSVRKA